MQISFRSLVGLLFHGQMEDGRYGVSNVRQPLNLWYTVSLSDIILRWSSFVFISTFFISAFPFGVQSYRNSLQILYLSISRHCFIKKLLRRCFQCFGGKTKIVLFLMNDLRYERYNLFILIFIFVLFVAVNLGLAEFYIFLIN